MLEQINMQPLLELEAVKGLKGGIVKIPVNNESGRARVPFATPAEQ